MYETNTFKKLKKVNKELKGFKTFLLNFERDGQFLTKLEKYAESIEGGITEFKNEAANQFENIQDEIDMLTGDLENFEQKIDGWKEGVKNGQKIRDEILNNEYQANLSKRSGSRGRFRSSRNASNFDPRD
jgi:hypothetical protein